MAEKHLVAVFMPSLVAVLIRSEKQKGMPLAEHEVLETRDKAIVMMMRAEEAAKMEESRGYRDIDPDNCWMEWQQIRQELREEDSGA